MPRLENRRDNLLGIAFGLASVALFSAQALVVKLVGDRVPMNEIVFFRHAFALIPAIVMVMRQGRVVEEGPAATLFAAPKSDYTSQLLAAIPGQSRLEA